MINYNYDRHLCSKSNFLKVHRNSYKISTRLISKVKNKTNWLSANAEVLNHQMLKGDEFKNIFKLRIGDYRILYDLDRANKTITFIKIGHRKDIYKF